MRRSLLLVVTALLATSALSPAAGAVIGHAASGTGTSSQNNGSSFDFTATGGPGTTGGGATGSMTYQEARGNDVVQAQVRCLWVAGNRATVVGLIVASSFPPPSVAAVGNYMIFYVEDNGTPGAGLDEWSAFFGGASETDCRQFVDLANPIQTGEIVVTEAAPPPSCPPGDDDDDDGDDDGLADDREGLFGAMLNDSDSDDDGVSDGNEDSDDDGEDDEDEDDDEDECPDDTDGDGTDDEDEDD